MNWKLGLLWVTDGSGYRVSIYKLGGSTAPIETIGAGYPFSVAVQNRGKPIGISVYGDVGGASVSAFKPGSYTPYATLRNGVDEPTGLLIGKP